MDDNQWMTDRFEERRTRLRGVAYRMLGSVQEADDASRRPGCASPGPTPAAWRTSTGG